ncbi:MAG: aldo/keto reductase [Anaerolineae bacterium]|nr:aldo/keto reductase [Anaerolineae bacterium]
MEYRALGRTGLQVSALGFGCGAVGGLLVKGEYREMIRVIARAIELGVTYFDTARVYGNGKSEDSLGRCLSELGSEVVVGTKVQIQPDEIDRIEKAVVASVEGSLLRLRMDCVDLIQLHNRVKKTRHPDQGWLGVAEVEKVLQAFEKLQQQGKVKHWGINGLGNTGTLHRIVAHGHAETIQCCYNLINPSAGIKMPPEFPFQNYDCLIDAAAQQHMGVIAIRVLAAGALSGATGKHPNAAPNVAPIATNASYEEDVIYAQNFNFLVEQGITSSLVEAAIRFSISNPAISTTLVGISNMEQLEQAVEAANTGSLPLEIIPGLSEIWNSG